MDRANPVNQPKEKPTAKKGTGKKFSLPKKKTVNEVSLTGFFYFADSLKVKEGRFGRYVCFCLVQEQRGEKGMKKIYLPVRFFKLVDEIEKIELFSYIEIKGTFTSAAGAHVKGESVKVLEPGSRVVPDCVAIPPFVVQLDDEEMQKAILRDSERRRGRAGEDEPEPPPEQIILRKIPDGDEFPGLEDLKQKLRQTESLLSNFEIKGETVALQSPSGAVALQSPSGATVLQSPDGATAPAPSSSPAVLIAGSGREPEQKKPEQRERSDCLSVARARPGGSSVQNGKDCEIVPRAPRSPRSPGAEKREEVRPPGDGETVLPLRKDCGAGKSKQRLKLKLEIEREMNEKIKRALNLRQSCKGEGQ